MRLFVTASLLAAMLIGSSLPAAAATTLCSGTSYATCTNAGYTDHGFSANNSNSYWGAFAGHNCTNYVAYVESTVNGAASPGNDLGNAADWATNAAIKHYAVDGFPRVGSVAQWDAYAGGKGADGHVAYVEAVNTDGSITISQDVYSSGPFSWQTISPGDAVWPSHFIHFKDLTGTTSSQRIVTLHSDGNLYVKEGSIGAGLVLLDSGVTDFAAAPTRIAALDSTGGLWIKDGSIYAGWVEVATGVSPGNFAVTNDMIAVQWGSTLDVKVGSIYGSWTPVMNPIVDFKVSASDHIAARMSNGHINLQWGPVGSGWADEGAGIDTYNLTDDMFGVTWGGYLSIKQGGPYATWSTIMNPVTGFGISAGDHIAALMTNGHLNVEWGPVGSGWTDVASAFNSYAITDSRVGVLSGGALSVKEGSVGATWTLVDTGVSKFVMT